MLLLFSFWMGQHLNYEDITNVLFICLQLWAWAFVWPLLPLLGSPVWKCRHSYWQVCSYMMCFGFSFHHIFSILMLWSRYGLLFACLLPLCFFSSIELYCNDFLKCFVGCNSTSRKPCRHCCKKTPSWWYCERSTQIISSRQIGFSKLTEFRSLFNVGTRRHCEYDNIG